LGYNEAVGSIIPCVFDYTTFRTSIGSNYSTMILSLSNDNISMLMSKMGLRLKEVRMPNSGGNEILLHEQVAANKQLKIGNYIGRLVNKDETLPNGYQVVGIIEGDPIISFAPIDAYINSYNMSYEYMYGALLLPKGDSLDKMNSLLDTMGPSNYKVETENSQEEFIQQSFSRVGMLITLINVLVIVIVSFCVGFLCYIYFSERKSEFGLLWAIGFSRQQVINRAFIEVSGINFAGFVCGILLSLATGFVLNQVHFIHVGEPLKMLNAEYLMGAACSPVFVTLFSLIPIWRMLKKLDPISIIEGVM
jgi:putative ABC transport system permease protein